MATLYYPQFDVVLIDADGIRTVAAAEDINVDNITAASSLGTLTTTADGVIVQGSFTADAGDIVEFSHDTYPGTFRFTLQPTQEKAYSEFESDTAAFVLENLRAARNSDLVRVFAKDTDNPEAPPFEVGAGKPGTTIKVPYQTNIDQNLALFPISFTERNKSQANFALEETLKQDLAVPATGTSNDEFLYLGRDYADDSQAAIDDNPTDPIVLRVENLDVSVTDNITWPDNITLDFHAGGSFEVAEKKRVTIAKAINMDPATRYFRPATTTGSTISSVNTGTETLTTSAAHGLSVGDAVFFTTTGALPGGLITNSTFYVLTVPSSTTLTVGIIPDGTAVNLTSSGSGTNKVIKPGEVILERNATGGVPYVAWWADDESAEDDNHAINQARASLGDGAGQPHFGDRLYYIDNQQIIEGMYVEGVGNDIDGSGYSSTYTGKGTRFVPSNLASTNPLWFAKDYFRNAGIRNCSISVQQSTTAWCLGLLGNFAPNTGSNPYPTSGLGFLAENVSFHSYLANSNGALALQRPLVKVDGTASWAEEVVIEFRHCTALAAGDYTNLYYVRSSNTGIIFHGGSVTASTGGTAYKLDAYGWVKWTLGDERKGSPVYTLQPIHDRDLTLSFDASDRKLTSAGAVFTEEDTSKTVVRVGGLPGAVTINEFHAGLDNIVTNSAHGFSVNDVVYFETTGTLGGGISANTAYYVIAVGSSTVFQVSTTLGGSSVNITSDGTGTNTVIKTTACYISKVISPYEALVSSTSGGTDFTSQTVRVYSVGKNGTLGYAVVSIAGTGSTISYDAGADEAFRHFIVKEGSQYGGVINITSRLIQSDILVKSGLGEFSIRGCDIYSGLINDMPGRWQIGSVDTSTDVITLVASAEGGAIHEFLPGQEVYFETTGSLPGGLSTGTPYYVHTTPAPHTFQVSASLGGSVVNITSAGSGTHTTVNPHGGGASSIALENFHLSKFSLMNYLVTERATVWQRRDGSSGLKVLRGWAEDYNIGTTVSTFRQIDHTPLPAVFYDPNPLAPTDGSGAPFSVGTFLAGQTQRRWGMTNPANPDDLLYPVHGHRSLPTGNDVVTHSQGDAFLLYREYPNMGVLAARGHLGTGGSYPNGYTAAACGSVTQATSKSTGVTLNKAAGRITMHNANLGANTAISFVLTNNAIAATDTLNLHVVGGFATSPFDYELRYVPAAGSATIHVKNVTLINLAESVVIAFEVVKTPI